MSSLLEGSFAKDTYNIIDPTNRSHPICTVYSIYEYMQCIYAVYIWIYAVYIWTVYMNTYRIYQHKLREYTRVCYSYIIRNKCMYSMHIHSKEVNVQFQYIWIYAVYIWIVYMNPYSAVYINTNWGNVHVHIVCMLFETSVCTDCTSTRKKWMYSLQHIWIYAVDIWIVYMITYSSYQHKLKEWTCVYYVYLMQVFVRVHERHICQMKICQIKSFCCLKKTGGLLLRGCRLRPL